jgi:dihydropyrimidine dehydrogenase (NAD+) subunit PreT
VVDESDAMLAVEAREQPRPSGKRPLRTIDEESSPIDDEESNMFRAGQRRSLEELNARFADVPPPLAADEALAEATRCLFCFDAPCTRACPTQIDVPKFIRQILHRDDLGAARTILGANVFGGSCARACPTEVLCEGACVDHLLVKAPVQIGRLQRHACDAATAADARFFSPGPATGKRVAVVGSGPAGLSCAHELRRFGHDVLVFESRGIPGGLDLLGIAAYKISTEFAAGEIEAIRRIGIEVRLDHPVDGPGVCALLSSYDAVFLGIGLGRTVPLGVEGEDQGGVWEALDFIFQTHTGPLTECTVGTDVIVIGAGNTAIDVATAAVRLGAETVTIVYRRSEALIPAFAYEYALARADGVRFIWNAQPVRIVAEGDGVRGVEFARTASSDPDSRRGAVWPLPGSNFVLPADMVVKALGQEPLLDLIEAVPGLVHSRGRICVDPSTGATSVDRLFAGGDCLRNGGEIVDAVQDGKVAARGIHAAITRA